MTLGGATRRDLVAVLGADPELGERLEPERLARAQPQSVARVLRRERGRWDAKQDADHGRDGLGLLIIDGMVVRRVGMRGRYGAELLTAGDLLQPAAHDGEQATLPFESTWQVMTPLRLAVLDLDWMMRMSAYPEIFAQITLRVMERSRRLASMLAIAHHHRLDDRLLLFFWELADRYGRVCPDGVRLEVDLTHELISHLVGAHRPSVSAALARLQASGTIARTERHWLLTGPQPDPAA